MEDSLKCVSKISIIGAGNVGAATAKNLSSWCLCDEVVLLDIKEGIAEGKASDINQANIIVGLDTIVTGVTNNYEATSDSDIIIITSGTPRKPGMTREQLVTVNSKVLQDVLTHTSKYSPEAIYIIVSNPMDTMTFFTCQFFEHKRDSKIIGMGGALDSGRFKYNISKELGVPARYIDAYVLGGHGDSTMIPMVAAASVNNKPLLNVATEQQIDKIVTQTTNGGAIITEQLGVSAWEGPAAAITTIVQAIADDTHEVFPCSIYRNEFDACIGTRVSIGRTGIENIIPDDKYLNDIILKYHDSIDTVRRVNEQL